MNLNDAIRKIRQRLEHATVPHEEFDRTLRGDEADRSEIARHMRSLPEADREVVREVWARENPNNPLW